MRAAQNRAATLPQRKEPIEVVWTSDKGASWVRYASHVQPGGGPEEDPGHAGGYIAMPRMFPWREEDVVLSPTNLFLEITESIIFSPSII